MGASSARLVGMWGLADSCCYLMRIEWGGTENFTLILFYELVRFAVVEALVVRLVLIDWCEFN